MRRHFEPHDRSVLWGGIVASLLLHVIFAVILTRISVSEPPPSLSVQEIPVEFLSLPLQTKSQEEGKTALPIEPWNLPRAVETEKQSISGSAAAETTTGLKPDSLIQAKLFYSTKILTDPRSKSAREGLRSMETNEQITQLCNIEAMEQIHHWKASLHPEFLIAYALAPVKRSGQTIVVDGGAFYTSKHWYSVKFKCDVLLEHLKVVSFAFSVGSEISKQDLVRHSLVFDDKDND